RDIYELRRAGLKVLPSDNDRRVGIAAVKARLATGRLRILHNTCPNLLAEAGEYRYAVRGEERASEADTLGSDHAVDALRYLVVKLDRGFLAKLRKRNGRGEGGISIPAGLAAKGKIVPEDVTVVQPPERKPRKWLSVHNEALWTPVGTIWRE